jgi:hypothetical protein
VVSRASLQKPTVIDLLIQKLKVEHPDVNRDPASPARRNHEIATATLAPSMQECLAVDGDVAIMQQVMSWPNMDIFGHFEPLHGFGHDGGIRPS